jgi:hypothetical protein
VPLPPERPPCVHPLPARPARRDRLPRPPWRRLARRAVQPDRPTVQSRRPVQPALVNLRGKSSGGRCAVRSPLSVINVTSPTAPYRRCCRRSALHLPPTRWSRCITATRSKAATAGAWAARRGSGCTGRGRSSSTATVNTRSTPARRRRTAKGPTLRAPRNPRGA